MLPRISSSSSKNLGVSSFLPRASSVNSRLSVSRVFINHSGFAIDSRKRREFIVKAEESTEGETEAVVENAVETEAEGEGEATVAEEAKPPRKTRVKLGDIMGVSSFSNVILQDYLGFCFGSEITQLEVFVSVAIVKYQCVSVRLCAEFVNLIIHC